MTDDIYNEFIKLLQQGPITSTLMIERLKCGRDDFTNKITKARQSGLVIGRAKPPQSIYALKGWTNDVRPGTLSAEGFKLALTFIASTPKSTPDQIVQFLQKLLYLYNPEDYNEQNS